jgi:predicted transcriptional regulator
MTQQVLCEHAKEPSMGTPKEEVRKLLDQIPDDSTFEDIQYHIYVREKIVRGLKDVEEGRVLRHEEVERKMAKWLGK